MAGGTEILGKRSKLLPRGKRALETARELFFII